MTIRRRILNRSCRQAFAGLSLIALLAGFAPESAQAIVFRDPNVAVQVQAPMAPVRGELAPEVPAPRVDCGDGRIAPRSDTAYVVDGQVVACDSTYRVSLTLSVFRTFHRGNSPPVIDETLLTSADVDQDGRFSLRFDWCRDVSGNMPPETPQVFTMSAGVRIEVVDTFNNVRVFHGAVPFSRNRSTFTVQLIDDPEVCNDFLRRERLYITQAVKSKPGTPMIVGRPTVARLFARTVRESVGVVTGVPARLRGFRDGVELPGSPLSPEGSGTINVSAFETFEDRENDETKSWNFLLPESWTSQAGEIGLRGIIDPDNGMDECESCQDNNELPATVEFSRGRHLQIQPYRVLHPATSPFTEQMIQDTLEGILATYPYEQITILPTKDHGVSAADDVMDILDDMLDKGCSFFNLFCSDKIHLAFVRTGQLPPHPKYGRPGGIAYMGKPASVTSSNIWTAAQEVGHNYDREHAGNSHGEAGGGSVDDNYPYSHGSIGPVGFDVARMKVVSDSHTHDFMSYGNGVEWISDYTWEALFDSGFSGSVSSSASTSSASGVTGVSERLVHRTQIANIATEVVLDRAPEPTTLAWVRGSWSFEGVELDPLYVGTLPAGAPLPPQKGELTVRALDARGNVLASRRFDVVSLSDDAASGRIHTVVPFLSGTARIAVVDAEGRVVAEQSVSELPSVAQRLPPAVGELLLVDQLELVLQAVAPETDGFDPVVVFAGPSGDRQRADARIPGDCNADGSLDIADANCVLSALFGGTRRLPCGDGRSSTEGNIALLDWQGDGSLDISDPVAILHFLFLGGEAHAGSVLGEPRSCVPFVGCAGDACSN